jgi:outer membrane biosynthesis protein TonB
MGRLSAFLLTLALGAVTALGLIACGSGDGADLLPGSTASEITSNLDQVEQLANEGDCAGAAAAAQAVSTQVDELSGVDEKLKRALREGALRLNEVVFTCEEATVEEEELPAIEEAVEPEEEEPKEKPGKPEKPKQETEEEPEEPTTTPTLPPQAEGKAKGHEKSEEAPPVEAGSGTPSGGVGPGAPVEGE